MSVIQTSIFTVVQRFPSRKDAVKRLFRKSEPFQVLCEDYRQCTKAMQRWAASASQEAPARKAEYSALLKELEGEIKEILDEYETIG